MATIVVFYELYSMARNTQGSGSTSPTHAFRNARVVIHLERLVGLYQEETIQRLFLTVRPVMKGFNVYYGTAHFIVTAGVLAWLYLRQPDRYARWRWALAVTTLLGLVGFVAFPVMPPRLISPAFGMGSYVDTLHTIGGLWNFEDGAIAKLSNQYAAMPSLHFAWSLWCCLALWPRLRSRWARTLAVAHPVITLTAIIATANHFWLDA
ncbi:MAG: phosphatase PAP2 family protein, partial [Acidimicrobiales bacterium]